MFGQKTLAIVQARLGSSRLPGKVLLPLAGRTVLWHIVNRLKSVQSIDEIVVATSDQPENRRILDYCQQNEIPTFVGSEHDVLDRFYKTALAYSAQKVIRVTADCPLVDPETIGRLIDVFEQEKFDYCAVFTGAGAAQSKEGRYPDGLDCEIFRFSALEKAWSEASQAPHREHVTPYIWLNPSKFNLGRLSSPTDLGFLRVTLDHQEDYNLICWIYEQIYRAGSIFRLDDVLALLKNNKEKFKANVAFIGHEGYQELWNENT